MSREEERLDEGRARAIWQRAAELQAEAQRREEERAREEAGRSLARGDGLSAADVEAAAVEAGIAPEFVQLAMAEEGGPLDPEVSLAGWSGRGARWMLGGATPRRQLSRSIDATPEAVLDAMRNMLPQHPYHLTLHDTLGDPLDGGILVFDVPSAMTSSFTPFTYALAVPDIEQLHFLLRPDRTDGGENHPVAGTELILSFDLRHGARLNFLVGSGLAGACGAAVGAGAGALVAAAAAPALGVLAGAVVLAGTAGGSGLGYRALFGRGVRKAVDELEKLLKQIDVHTRVGGGFRARPPRSSDDPGMRGGSGFGI